MVTSIIWIRPWGIKYMVESGGGIESKTDDLISRCFNRVECAE